MLKLTPEQVRSMTINEFSIAVNGYLESKGIKTNNMKWEDVEDLMEKHDISEKSYSIKQG